MNSIHDMGGMHNMGPVDPEADEPVFHADWEARMFALSNATRTWGKWNIDQSRHAREAMPPADYLASSYYEIWHYGSGRDASSQRSKKPTPDWSSSMAS